MATIELAVPTVHCTACKLNIEESLEDVAGVAASSVDLDGQARDGRLRPDRRSPRRDRRRHRGRRVPGVVTGADATAP